MANKGKIPEHVEKMIANGAKKYVRYAEGAELYSMGHHAFMRLAREAGAVRKIQGICLVNIDKVNKYIEEMYG